MYVCVGGALHYLSIHRISGYWALGPPTSLGLATPLHKHDEKYSPYPDMNDAFRSDG